MAMAIARGRSMGEINITPLVDVMLVLLVIFMVTVPAVTQTNPLDLPQGTNDRVDPSKPVRLLLTAGDTVEWNGEALSASELRQRFDAAARAAAGDPARQPALTLYADPGADYQQLTRVLASASNAGLVKIVLADARP